MDTKKNKFLKQLNKLDIPNNTRYMIWIMSNDGPFEKRSLVCDYNGPIDDCWGDWYTVTGYPMWNWSTNQYRLKNVEEE
jgi:hypothetical protein